MNKSVCIVYVLFFLIIVNSPINLSGQETKIETVVQTGHYAELTAVTCSNNGQFIATGSKDKTIKLWNASNGREIRSLTGSNSSIISLEFDNSDTYIVSVCENGIASVWEVKTGIIITHIAIEEDRITCATFGNSENEIITGSEKSFVSTWNVKTGEKIVDYIPTPVSIKTAKNYTYPGVKTIQISKDKKYIVAGSNDRTTIVWDKETGKEIKKFKKNKYTCTSCLTESIITHDNKYIISSNSDSIKIFDFNTGKLAKELFYKKGRYSSLTFHDNSGHLAAIQYNTLIIWNINKGRVIKEIKDKKGQINAITFNTKGDQIIIANKNRMADIVNIKSGETVMQLKGYLNQLDERLLNHSFMYWAALVNETKLSNDGKYIAVGRTGNNAKLVNFSTGKVHQNLQGHSNMVISIDFSNDNKYIVTGGLDGKAILWNVSTGESIKRFSYRDSTNIIFSVDLSSDGKLLATSNWSGYVTIWDTETGKAVRHIKPHEGAASYKVKFGPNNIYLFSAGLDRKLKLLEIGSGEEVKSFIGHTNVVSSILFHPDNKQFITSSWDNYIRVWDFYSGLQVKKIHAHEGGAYSAIYNKSGEFIVSGGNDNLAKIWDANTGELLNAFEGHKGAIGTVNITPDNNYLITGSRDGTIKIWNIEQKKEMISYAFLNEDDWFIKSPQGYFDASDGAYQSISFVKGTEVYSADQFFNDFFIPGLYREIMQGKTDEMRNNVLHQLEEFPPPTVKIITPKTDSILEKNKAFFITRVINNGGGIKELKVLHNGKRIPIDDTDLKKINRKGQFSIESFNILLVPGENIITISAFNKGNIESAYQEIKLYYQGRPKTSRCYFMSIGINKYENSILDLRYAKPDAKAMIDVLGVKGNKLFKEIKIYEIFDNKATKENIFHVLDEIASDMVPEDVFILFYAGHGSTVNNYFYFITTETTGLYQEDKLKKALNVNELQEKLKELPALKQVVFLDACHSGTSVDVLATRGASEEKALAQLSRSTGIHVLASAGGTQQAAEVSSLGHGVFTHVLLEALSGKADGAPKDSKITIYELKSYLDDQVPEISFKLLGHKQYPTTFSIGHDFPIVFE